MHVATHNVGAKCTFHLANAWEGALPLFRESHLSNPTPWRENERPLTLCNTLPRMSMSKTMREKDPHSARKILAKNCIKNIPTTPSETPRNNITLKDFAYFDTV